MDGHSSPTSPDVPHSRRSSSASSASPSNPRTTARKRILYAHSDILNHRSEYFATMLNSSFVETTGNAPGERKLWRVVVEETDFQTMYWVLKYLYASYCAFKAVDDPRAAVDGVGTGLSVKWLHSRGGEWDWRTFARPPSGEDHGDSRSIASASGESNISAGDPGRAVIPPKDTNYHSGISTTLPRSTSSRNPPLTPSKPGPSVPGGSRPGQTTVRKPTTSQTEPHSPETAKPPSSLPISIPNSKYQQSHFPLSPRSQRPSSVLAAIDPHPHPTPCPTAASALSIYQAAHRYNMPQLANLALDHIMTTITPDTSLALLLATAVWDELRNLVEVSSFCYPFAVSVSSQPPGVHCSAMGRSIKFSRVRAVFGGDIGGRVGPRRYGVSYVLHVARVANFFFLKVEKLSRVSSGVCGLLSNRILIRIGP